MRRNRDLVDHRQQHQPGRSAPSLNRGHCTKIAVVMVRRGRLFPKQTRQTVSTLVGKL
jgi:hypothetical protein